MFSESTSEMSIISVINLEATTQVRLFEPLPNHFNSWNCSSHHLRTWNLKTVRVFLLDLRNWLGSLNNPSVCFSDRCLGFGWGPQFWNTSHMPKANIEPKIPNKEDGKQLLMYPKLIMAHNYIILFGRHPFAVLCVWTSHAWLLWLLSWPFRYLVLARQLALAITCTHMYILYIYIYMHVYIK